MNFNVFKIYFLIFVCVYVFNKMLDIQDTHFLLQFLVTKKKKLQVKNVYPAKAAQYFSFFQYIFRNIALETRVVLCFSIAKY